MARMSKLEKQARKEGWLRDKQPESRDPRLIYPGEFATSENGAVWECVGRTDCAVTMKGVFGKGKNSIAHWAPSAVVTKITAEELEERRNATAKLAAVIEDENQCPNCWAGDEDDGTDRGRDTSCSNHIPKPESIRVAKEGKRRAKFVPTDEEIAKVLKLRATGMGYQKIEKELGWPDSHGNKAWKIVKHEEKKGA